MNAPFGTPTIDRPCHEVLAQIQQALALAGLHSLETFDLRAARVRAVDCACPRHGSAPCDCQMVVLLAYRMSSAPATVILHGSDGQTWLSIPDEVLCPADPAIVAIVEDTVRTMRGAQGSQ